MNRMKQLFKTKKSPNQKYFIPFIMAGDPSIEATKRTIKLLADEGCDVIEIGVPFSDPIADGEVIQNAHLRGIEAGVGLEEVFEMIKEIREECQVPIALMIYGNLIWNKGIDAFFECCHHVGIDGVIIPDVPIEESPCFEDAANPYDIAVIRLIAPSSGGRTGNILEGAKGFLYCVSSLGVTGVRREINPQIYDFLKEVKGQSEIPIAVGFGIGSPDQAEKLLPYVDGVIVGSAIVNYIAQYGEEADVPLRGYIKRMRETIDGFF